ncbi:CURVATURE THYLAKOID 1C [Hibiscus trionum]|uniref:CURVATURE THYLAKOID 1C n=1 Tax=Hibiscus trionum TaxID=183268 RepID=A0A9W7MAU1_HIBTR|nr:CURVATURE THYLAKOID 1C [Hibiscus trionum]
MASLTASLLPPLLLQDRKTLFRTSQKPLVSFTGGRRNCAVIVKATGDSSESSTSLSIVKSVRDVWDKSDEDKVGLIGLGFAAIVALWTSTNVISAVDKLPIIPVVLEIIGILFSTWFVYRYLLFKPDREELYQIINKTISQIFGQ